MGPNNCGLWKSLWQKPNFVHFSGTEIKMNRYDILATESYDRLYSRGRHWQRKTILMTSLRACKPTTVSIARIHNPTSPTTCKGKCTYQMWTVRKSQIRNYFFRFADLPQMWQFADLRYADNIFLRIFEDWKLPQILNFFFKETGFPEFLVGWICCPSQLPARKSQSLTSV